MKTIEKIFFSLVFYGKRVKTTGFSIKKDKTTGFSIKK